MTIEQSVARVIKMIATECEACPLRQALSTLTSAFSADKGPIGKNTTAGRAGRFI